MMTTSSKAMTADHFEAKVAREKPEFLIALIVSYPAFLFLVVVSRLIALFGLLTGHQQPKRPTILREALEWDRATIAVSFQA